MRRRRDSAPTCSADGPRGVKGFLRSLLAGIHWSERAEEETVHHIAAPPSGVFRVHNANGRTRILAEDREDVEITASKTARAESAEAAAAQLAAVRIEIAESPDSVDLDVEVPRRGWNRCGAANLCIRIPRATHVTVIAANGRIDVEGIRGLVAARSSNGSVHVTDVVGDVEVATSNAKVCCSRVCGKLTARSSNGKIEIDEHRGSVDASTSNGLIRTRIEELGKEGAQLATSNGRILIDLPDDAGADVDVRVDNGVIRNDLELAHTTRDSDGRLVGRLGDGGPLVKLRTSNGSISLL